MMTNLISIGFSFAIHLLFLTLVILSTYALKARKSEEVKIFLMDSPPKELRLRDLPEVLPPINNLPQNAPSKEKTKIRQAPLNANLSKAEEEILRKKLVLLKKKNISQRWPEVSEEELEDLHRKISTLKRKEAQRDNSTREAELIPEESKFEKEPPSNPVVPTSEAQNKLSLEFLLLVKRKLQANFEVPIYLRSKQGLSAKVLLEVDKSGRILNYTFMEKSKNSEFNQAIERCLKFSSPLPVDRSTKILIEFHSSGVGKVS